MNGLIDQAWKSFEYSRTHPCLINPACPVLWFGDLNSYRTSSLKVVTVGLNPSRKEFPQENAFLRFPKAEVLYPDILSGVGRSTYAEALSEYFLIAPYRSWFGWFNEILVGMGASYYPGSGNIALHTDLCSPLATDPTWSRLGHHQIFFENQGIPQWHQLIDELAPDILIFSIARRYMELVKFINPSNWRVLHTVPRTDPLKRPYNVYVQQPMDMPLIIFGQAAQQPFATLNKLSRQGIGNAISTHLAKSTDR